MRSILLIHKPQYRQQGRVHERGTGITVDVSCEERSRKNCWSVNHETSFLEKITSLVAFFPCYHSKCELAGRLMLVAEKSVPVRSEDKNLVGAGLT